MNIFLLGTHSTGKSTQLNLLKKSDILEGFLFKDGNVRDLLREGRFTPEELNDRNNINPQIIIAEESLKTLEENKNKDIVYTRSVIDTLSYIEQYNFKFLHKFLIEFKKYTSKLFNEIDSIGIFFNPTVKFVRDGVRPDNEEERLRVSNCIEKYAKQYVKTLYYLESTSIEDRNNEIIEIINKYS